MSKRHSARELGSQFVIGLPGPNLDAATRNLLKTVRPGGVILFAINLRSPEQIAGLNRELRSILGRDLLICIDHEGGRVNRLVEFTGKIPSAQQLCILNNPQLALEHGRWCGKILRILGFNFNLAPVLDLLLKPNADNSVPDRCWGSTADQVTNLAGAFLSGMQTEGILGCGKHFPGYGGVDKDPHLFLPRIERSAWQMYHEDMVPYEKLIGGRSRPKVPSAGRLHAVMISHAHTAAFDAKKMPALLSKFVVQKILRLKYRFKGVIISDDLEMGAIIRTMSVESAAVKTLDNGVDLPLICHTPEKIVSAFEASVKAAEKNKIQPSTLRACRARVRAFKACLRAPLKFNGARWAELVRGNHAFTENILSLLPEDAKELNLSFRPVGETYTPKYED